uniref:Profilin n=1 Tax=Angiostrongylus cantonensis TaxID=6313 RepID=A0A0K0D753_ANGCA
LYDHEAFGFRSDEMAELMDGKYMGIGLSKSVKVLEGDGGKCGPFVVADGSQITFYKCFASQLYLIYCSMF